MWRMVQMAAMATVLLMSVGAARAVTFIEITYSGTLADGNDATGVFGSVGSLAGDPISATLFFDISRGTYSSTANSSSLIFGPTLPQFNPAPAFADMPINRGEISIGFNISATDQAIAGFTSQSLSEGVPQAGNDLATIAASVSDPSISSSILQGFSLTNVPLSLTFLISQSNFPGCNYCYRNVWGDITFGDVSVSLYTPPNLPLPAALPLFATGLGAMGLLGWRRKRKNAAAIAAV